MGPEAEARWGPLRANGATCNCNYTSSRACAGCWACLFTQGLMKHPMFYKPCCVISLTLCSGCALVTHREVGDPSPTRGAAAVTM